ncbi:MAG: hypothetical protein JNL28_03270 [Planctomycetes bacterium]|nr:hypothetical protein [Planctomycetota bacterium]
MSAPLRGRSVRSRDLSFVLLLGAAALPALIYGSRGEPDPLAALCWIALIATAGGYACGAQRVALWPLAPVAPVLWLVTVAFADALSRRDLPSVAWSALPVFGLFGLGFALGARAHGEVRRGVAALFLAAVLLAALPLHGLLGGSGFDARVSALLLDASPATLLAECAGVDWMRHPPIYDGSATVDIHPALRSPYSARLAGSLVFVVGCSLAFAAEHLRRRRDAAAAARE